MECPVCHGANVYGAARCGQCGSPLDAATLAPDADIADPTRPDEHTRRPWEPDATAAEPVERPWEPERTQIQPNPWGPQGNEAWQGPTWRYDQDIPGAVVPPPEPWQAPPPPPRRRNRTAQALIAAWIIVVAAAITAVAIAFWPQGKHKQQRAITPLAAGSTPASTVASTSAAPSDDAAKPQATAIDELLTSMATSRTELGTAMSDAAQCLDLDTAVPDLRKVVNERSTQLDTARNLQVSALGNGDAMKNALTRALQGSLDADNHFLSWAQNNQGCTGTTPQDSDFTQGGSISANTAQPAKIEFLGYWATVAQQQGLPPRDKDHI